jgi:hypothetical protein
VRGSETCLWCAVFVFWDLLKCLRRIKLKTEIRSTDQTQDNRRLCMGFLINCREALKFKFLMEWRN